MIKIPTRILIVDDDTDFTEMFSLRLTQQGEQVTCAHSGAQALEILGNTSIDVVILDIRMPGMDGIETLKHIKATHPIVEVILLTGHGTTETAVQGMRQGAFDYMMKPADPDEFNIKLEQAWKRKEAQEERIRKAEARFLLRRSGDI